MDERYSIHVKDDYVEIQGELTIEETFDFINFFEKKGYQSLIPGWDHSTILLCKQSIEEKQQKIIDDEKMETEGMYHLFYEREKSEHLLTKTRVEELESLIKQLMDKKDDNGI